MNTIDYKFANGNCAALAKKLNELYGFEIYHIFHHTFDESTSSDEDGFIHTLVKVQNNFLDIFGLNSAEKTIRSWYYNRCVLTSDVDLFIVNDDLTKKISIAKKKVTESELSKENIENYGLAKFKTEIDYDFEDQEYLEKTARNLFSEYVKTT